jgi:lipopolysaccharide/colanic/teichoic acid biosynthesis glycosyltransferase
MDGTISNWQWSRRIINRGQGKNLRLYYYGKRLMDLTLTILALIFLAPLMLLIALLIKLDSPGPVFFVQERVGSRRRTAAGQMVWEIKIFRFYKFRSMFHNSDQSIHRQLCVAFVNGTAAPALEAGSKYKLKKDARITRIGGILRRTSLDELPQFFNVLKGEMSLVGPRPVPIYEAEAYQPGHFERLAALPGITGLWQVKGRGNVPFEEMISLDLEYLRSQSWGLDLKLLLLTIPAVLQGRGAE